MTLYRITTTYMGADGPTKTYYNDAAKAFKAFTACKNAEVEKVEVIADYDLNYSDGCTMNDLTFGDLDAIEIIKGRA